MADKRREDYMLEKSTSLLLEDRRAHGRLGYQSKEDKRQDAVERQTTERAGRTPQEQIAVLDRRLGAGQGAIKERAKLAALINK